MSCDGGKTERQMKAADEHAYRCMYRTTDNTIIFSGTRGKYIWTDKNAWELFQAIALKIINSYDVQNVSNISVCVAITSTLNRGNWVRCFNKHYFINNK